MKKRALSFNKLYIFKKGAGNVDPSPIITAIELAMADTKTKRVLDINEDRFCFINDLVESDGIYQAKLITARINYRPDYVDRKTLNRRPNAKTISEGEGDAVHIAFKIDHSTNEIVLILEERQPGLGLSIGQLSDYFVELVRKYKVKLENNQTIYYDTILSDDFISRFDNIFKVKMATLKINKQLFGSDALKFANLSDRVQDTVDIILKSKPRQGIKEDIKDIVKKVIDGNERRIKRIQLVGTDGMNNPIKLDTENAKRKQYIDISADEETGEVNSVQLFGKMKQILQDLVD